ncbi:signal peptidase II [Mycoplasmopsis adleri]|uniref:signal peptidase II n=1 Tax=Mycoplasmopsis adleri TaxID=51362 RepID=UPI0038738AEB
MEREKIKLPFKDRFALFWQRIMRDWKNILFKYIIFLGVFTILLIIDQVTKNYIFPKEAFSDDLLRRNLDYNYGIIGFTPLNHHGVTLFKINKETSFIFIHILSVVLFMVLLLTPLFINDYFIVIVLAGIAAGDMGNFIDRMANDNTVKDIIYSPFFDKWLGRSAGVFNFADAFIVGGIVIVVFYMFNKSAANSPMERLEDENMAYELFVDPVVLEALEEEKKKKGIEKILE